MGKTLSLIITGILTFALTISGQTIQDNTQGDTLQIQTMSLPTDNEIMTPSPKASSIIKYGEYPTSLYTGLVDITVPVYTIERSGIRIPIEFKYHASGIKYDDVSNEVGLGWTLVAGGVITRSVKGGRDGKINSYSKDITKIKTCDGNPSPLDNDYEKLRAVENGSRGSSYDSTLGRLDGEIDMYSFSFLDHSGTFCFPFSGSEVTTSAPSGGLFIPADGMRVIDRSSPDLYFELLDMNGIFYRFDVKDYDQNENHKEYYLTKVISANKADTITFSYEMTNSISPNYIRRPYINHSYSIIENTNNYFQGGPHTSVDYSELGGMNIQQMRPPRLMRIDFRGGHIDFEYTVVNGYKTWNLQKIKIFNNLQSLPFQTISLTKSNFTNGEQRLDKVTFTNTQGQSYNYQFGYNGNPGNSNSNYGSYTGVDFWGYYNGNNVPNGKRYVPAFKIMGIKGYSSGYTIPGTNRTPNESNMMKGILNKVIYPTKGYSEFVYEAHKGRYSQSTTTEIFGGLRIKEIRNYLPDGSLAEKKWYKYGENESGYGVSCMYPEANDFCTKSRALIVSGDPHELDVTYVIDTRSYSSFAKRNNLISGSTVVYPQVTEYVGNDTEDYGKTVYTHDAIRDEPLYSEGGTYRSNSADTHLRTFPWKTGKLKSKQVYKKEGGVYHLVSSVYNNYRDINTCEYRNVKVLPYVSFQYNTSQNIDIIKNYCSATFDKYYKYFSDGSSYTPYNYFNYYTTTGLRVLDESVETTDGVTTYTYYDSYNANGLPTKTRSTSSSEDTFSSVFKYPTDFTSTIYTSMKSANILTPVIEKTTYKNDNLFLGKEIINYQRLHSRFYAPENVQIQYQNGTIDTRLKYKYDIKGNVQEKVKDDANQVVYIWGYNNLYPIAEIKNATYSEVIAKISEVTLKTIANKKEPSYSDWTLIESLRTTLPNALITTCKYEPLIGIISSTDPRRVTTYYEYDTFGRLKETYLMENNVKKVIQSYDYHYQN
jgi:YD repeat-containing protein